MKKILKVFLITVTVILTLFVALAALNALNAKNVYEYIDTFGEVALENQLLPSVDEYGNAYFTTDGDFKVLHLTDLHFCGSFFTAENDKKAINAVAAMVSAEKPDLIIITGDLSYAVLWKGTINNYYGHSYAIRLFEELGVYWTVTLGNHDSESYNFYTRSDVADMYSDENLKYCLFDRGPKDVYGESNHVINVKNSAGLVTRSLIMLDSNAYVENNFLGLAFKYDKIRESQIEWYEDTVNTYNEANEKIYSSLDADEKETQEEHLAAKSLLFFHIPPREVKYAYDEYVNSGRENTERITYIEGNDGEEDPVVFCGEEDEQLFETVLSLGCTEAIFFGHDHLNNFVLSYDGVILSYGYSVDYSAYSGIDGMGYQRGCTVIDCRGGEFEITHENYYQDKYESLYEKEAVDMTGQ